MRRRGKRCAAHWHFLLRKEVETIDVLASRAKLFPAAISAATQHTATAAAAAGSSDAVTSDVILLLMLLLLLLFLLLLLLLLLLLFTPAQSSKGLCSPLLELVLFV